MKLASAIKRRIERRLGIVFGVFRTPPQKRQDFRINLRLGVGASREYVNLEAGVAGWNIYVGRQAT